jgi:PAS domain-containing protein
MSESRIDDCLELCAQARELEGERLIEALDKLKIELLSFREACRGVGCETAGSASEADWTHEPVITMDMAGYLTGWNIGAQILFGYTPEEAIGRHILFLYADEPEDHKDEIHEFFLDHGSPLLEVRRRKKKR